MRKDRFTLIELLVVIVIIAILASLLLPALSRAKYIAKNTLCTSNLRQVVMVYMSYTSDFDGFYPEVWPEYTDSFEWTQSEAAGARVNTYLLYNRATGEDIRPSLRSYSGGPLMDFMRCPLSNPYWQTGEGQWNIDTSTEKYTKSTYNIYPTGNQASKGFYVTERMRKSGGKFTAKDYTAAGMSFGILASDFLSKHINAPSLMSTQMPLLGTRLASNQYINGPGGWYMLVDDATYANFALDDGSCHTYRNVQAIGHPEFVWNKAKRFGDLLPTDLAE